MKLMEIQLGSKAHADLIAANRARQRPTVSKLKAAALRSTLPQDCVDELVGALSSVPGDKILTQQDIEQLAALSDIDIGELQMLAGL